MWISGRDLGGTLTDGELVERVRAGDTSAFAALYRAHVGAVYGAVYEVSHDRDTAREMVQEVFARALEQVPRLRDPQRFLPWLLSIARHTAIDQRRQQGRIARHTAIDQRRQQGRMETLEDAAIRETPDEGPGPESLAELRELARLVQTCLATLSRRDALAVSLVTYTGFRPAEVAAALGVSTGAAKVIVHRARRRLRAALAMELMVRRAGPTCGTFRSLHDSGQLVGAARHVQACGVCDEHVAAEIDLYDATLRSRAFA